jgi:hypothetical protein
MTTPVLIFSFVSSLMVTLSNQYTALLRLFDVIAAWNFVVIPAGNLLLSFLNAASA